MSANQTDEQGFFARWERVIKAQPSGVMRSQQQYQPDPVEEAYHASPQGLRDSARIIRAEAARQVNRAEAMERLAAEKEANHGS